MSETDFMSEKGKKCDTKFTKIRHFYKNIGSFFRGMPFDKK